MLTMLVARFVQRCQTWCIVEACQHVWQEWCYLYHCVVICWKLRLYRRYLLRFLTRLALITVGHTALQDQCAFALIYYDFLQSLNFFLHMLLFIALSKTSGQWKVACVPYMLFLWLVTSIIDHNVGHPDDVISCPNALQRWNVTFTIPSTIRLYALASCCKF